MLAVGGILFYLYTKKTGFSFLQELRGKKELMSFIGKKPAPSTRPRNETDQTDEGPRRYSRRSNVPDEELVSDLGMNPEAGAFMSGYRNPRAVSGTPARVPNAQEPRRFNSGTFIELPQITHEQLLLLKKMETCYYIDDENQMRDRHSGQIINIK